MKKALNKRIDIVLISNYIKSFNNITYWANRETRLAKKNIDYKLTNLRSLTPCGDHKTKPKEA